MAKAKGMVAGLYKQRQRGKRTRQGLGRNTKFSTRVASKRFKKKTRGQGK
tara:strand:+ start:183 stop:332 length:150 start_codon:yes stop_codon:yes gene_type:complete